jgi:FAD/FMN-containing dehydrogenase
MPSVQTESTCQQAQPLVDAGLGSRILLPTDSEYATRIGSYWCNNAKLKPACIVQPQSTAEVSQTIEALARARQVFAVRAGGHMNWAGSNNITGGVTIDLGFLNSTQYDANTQTARLGPGARWKDVYVELEKHGRTVAGAREGECGVGGFLLGGGNTFHTPSHGFACDNVVTYEVVLADGRIVIADAGGEHRGRSVSFFIFMFSVYQSHFPHFESHRATL